MSLRIVVVDDNVDLVESMISVLQLLGHDATGAHSGPDGIEMIAERRPDVALIDVAMPGMAGTEVATQVRSQSWGNAMVLIALTGWGRGEDRDRCMEAGFDHVALKPVDLDYLQVMLERVGAFPPNAMPAVTQAARTAASPFNAARP